MNTILDTSVRLIASPGAWIEGEALRQLYALARLEGVRSAVGFPDLHPGRGVPVGAVTLSHGVIYPHVIGGDIGCGMSLWKTDLPRRKARIDRWADLRFELEHPWEGDLGGWLQDNRLPSSRFDHQLGTIGGGNHFAELQAVERVHDPDAFATLGLDRDQLVVLVHSGSRGFGESVFWQHAATLGSQGLDWASSRGVDYLWAHDTAVRWARASREIIARRFTDTLGALGELAWDGCHNCITPRASPDGTVWIHRKGAVASDQGPVVIPGSRGSLSYLVQPIGDGESHAWSLAHGAGRKWARSESRARARVRHRLSELVQTPLGGRVICEERELLYEEAPLAYKRIEQIIGALEEAGLATVVATFRPMLTYKTRKQRR